MYWSGVLLLQVVESLIFMDLSISTVKMNKMKSLPMSLEVNLFFRKYEPHFPFQIDRKFVDGSIGADLPMQNLSEMFNVNYFVVSQANFWFFKFPSHMTYPTK